jgi:hypothetical protein
MAKIIKLIRTKIEVMQSINIMLNYYDDMMTKNGQNKVVAREQFFEMFHEYYEWLQGKS